MSNSFTDCIYVQAPKRIDLKATNLNCSPSVKSKLKLDVYHLARQSSQSLNLDGLRCLYQTRAAKQWVPPCWNRTTVHLTSTCGILATAWQKCHTRTHWWTVPRKQRSRPRVSNWLDCLALRFASSLWNWQSALAGFRQAQRPTWSEFWHGKRWVPGGKKCFTFRSLRTTLVMFYAYTDTRPKFIII